MDTSDTTQTAASKDLLDQATSLVSADLEKVDQLIRERLDSDIALIKTLSAYLIQSGGKRLRPLILLLCARACGYQGTGHINLAAIIEFIHTATLLHDDVVDSSSMRRGQKTANEVWGNEAAVLVGDFLYSRSFEMMVETDNMEVMRILARTTNAVAEGEVLQLMNAHSPETTEANYMQTILRKTARLFESSALLGGVIHNQQTAILEALRQYGMYLGLAFQLVDDIMDYDSNSHQIGKDIGDDLAEGRLTLPLIYTMRHANDTDRKLIQRVILQSDQKRVHDILNIVQASGSLDYVRQKAQEQSSHAADSLSVLPDSRYKNALIALARFSVNRSY